MNKLLLIHDDSVLPPEIIKKIVGNVKYSQIICRGYTLLDKLKEAVAGKCGIVVSETFLIEKNEYFDYSFIWMPSSSVIIDVEDFRLLLDKLKYAKESMTVCENGKILLAFYKNRDDLNNNHAPLVRDNYCLMDISDYIAFVRYLSENPETRFFNTITGNDYQFTKSSADKIKIRREYNFAQLIPDFMKKWIVVPYNYKEDANSASYEMERINIPDMAIRWIHKAVSLDEFEAFLDKFFYFITTRANKTISISDYSEKMKELYQDKVINRINELKKTTQYRKISEYIIAGTDYNSIEDIFEWYINLYKKLIPAHKFCAVSVIGHGDPFFANTFFDYGTKMLKFIDPKGADKENELWTDPYYDVAKLSHSILGSYDFIINELFSIQIDKNFRFSLLIDNYTLKSYGESFLNKAVKNGFNPQIIRLFEASLFLSMLPLHIDNSRHTFAFILNTVRILKEVENA